MQTIKSESLYNRSCALMPGGVNSPVRACMSVGVTPKFIEKGSGSHIYDADGNEYIDYVCSWGPNILGHAHPQVIEAVSNAIGYGLTFGAPTEKELTIAELINKCVPAMEMVRLVSSGTEAVMSAIRLARGFTGRDKIIKFQGCYHGHSDCLLYKSGSGTLTTGCPSSAGVTMGQIQDTLIAEYNDPQSVEDLFFFFFDQIAAVIVEPVAANMGLVLPQNNFLHFLREITENNGSLLIFDEVITGFRIALGGACEYYGIRPDLVTLGKIVGGGMPVGAYGGRNEIMQKVSPSGNVYQAGTLSGNPVSTAAGIATIKYLIDNETDVYAELDRKGDFLEKSLLEIFGSAVSVNRIGSLLCVFFKQGGVSGFSDVEKSDLDLFAVYYRFMLEHGIYLAPSQYETMFISLAHTDEDLEYTRGVMKKFAQQYLKK